MANPIMRDPNFVRTVVFLLAHSDQGALGVVLNRPSITDVSVPLPRWRSLTIEPAVVFVGGPVDQGAICLARLKSEVFRSSLPTSEHISGMDQGSDYAISDAMVATLDLEADPVMVAEKVEGIRVFAGYAGWGAGQLENELTAGGWWVVDPQPDDVFGNPAELWKRVLRRQGGELAIASAYPEDVSLN